MTSEHDSHKSYVTLLNALQEKAAKHDFDLKYLAHGGIIGTGSYYKILQNTRTNKVMLVAVHDPDDLTGCEYPREDGKFPGALYPASPQKLRIVSTYDHLPAQGSEIRGDILKDRALWFGFMQHYGNLLEVPLDDPNSIHFKNDFASYAAVRVKNRDGALREPPAYDIYAYYNARRHVEHSENPNMVEKFLYRVQNIENRGIRLGRVKGPRNDVEKFIHEDFCKRLARILETQNCLTPEDFNRDPAHFVSMLFKNELETLHIKKKWTFEEFCNAVKDIPLGLREILFDAAVVIYKGISRLRHARGKIWEALLPRSDTGFSQKHFPVNEVKDWRMLNVHEARVAPITAPVYDNTADTPGTEELLSAISSPKPCLIKDVGNGVISVQEPNGTKLYYGPDNEVYVVYSPQRRLEPVVGCDVDDFGIPEKLKFLFKEAGKVTCLNLKHPEMPNLHHASDDTPHFISYTIERTYLAENDAYAKIAKLAGCEAEILKAQDIPGMPTFVPNKILTKTAAPQLRFSPQAAPA